MKFRNMGKRGYSKSKKKRLERWEEIKRQKEKEKKKGGRQMTKSIEEEEIICLECGGIVEIKHLDLTGIRHICNKCGTEWTLRLIILKLQKTATSRERKIREDIQYLQDNLIEDSESVLQGEKIYLTRHNIKEGIMEYTKKILEHLKGKE